MPKVTFTYGGQTKTVEGKQGETLLQIGIDNGIPIEHACGGNGFCTTCLCKIKKGNDHLSARTEREENMGISDAQERLGCQAKLQNGDVEVDVIDI
ncbi:MAG: 2Fe-2S iron-sulfur cluster-binding protein [Candidatus Peribacteraceae bacterium]|nr:2Fe-2S iron-sulfur cluster-binding protein [Candidatus Peribacteraceae bacterium]